MRHIIVRCAAIAVAMSTTAAPCGASSEAAYAAFRADVAKTCTVLAKTQYADPIVLVDAHGSPSYGIAQVYGRTPSPKGLPQIPGLSSVICVYDKKTKKAELSAN